MAKVFKDKVLIEVDRVDGMGDFIPKEVMEKAVTEMQERMKKGTPLLITKKFSGKLSDTQGLISDIRMEGTKVLINGTILDTDQGKLVQELMAVSEVEYALGGHGTPKVDPETQVRTYSDVSISSVAAVPAGEKVR